MIKVPPAGAARAGQALQSAVLNWGNEFEESSSVSCRGSTLENYRTSTSNASIDIISTIASMTGVIGYTVRPNFRSGGPYSLREYGPPRTQFPREYGPPDRVPWLYKTN